MIRWLGNASIESMRLSTPGQNARRPNARDRGQGAKPSDLFPHSHTQVTDSYLLALAVANGGRLASMDLRTVVDAVIGGRAAFSLI
jgi:hypothetical protein